MSSRRRLSVWTSASQAAHSSHQPHQQVLSVDDLLDHTWHYECVVSPSYSALLKITELKAKSSHSSPKPAKSSLSPSSSSPKPAKSSSSPSSSSSSSSSTKPAKSSSSSSSSIKPAKSSSSSPSSSSSIKPAKSSSSSPSSSSTKPAINLPTLSTQSSTEYVSLASFINISNNNSYSSSSGRNSTSPGFNYLRKHSKPTNALSKCRDRERKSTREDTSRISLYAGFLAVD